MNLTELKKIAEAKINQSPQEAYEELVADFLHLVKNYEKAVEALKFYGDKKNWDERWVDSLDEESSGDIADIISINDYDDSGGENEFITGGKLARQTLKELGEVE